MPPKNRFTQEEILNAAFDIVRESGMDALTARTLAGRLNSSAKPIFGLFSSMEDVKQGVLQKAYDMYRARLEADMKKEAYPPYKASGMSYIRFAAEEKELFRLLFMCDRSRGDTLQNDDQVEMLIPLIMKSVGISREKAYLLHMEMWIFVHGVASMYVTNYLNLDMKQVSDMMTDVYQGLRMRFIGEEAETIEHD